jgi:lipoyl(octanoyl) transferase
MTVSTINQLVIRNLGYQDYQSCWHAMQSFTNARNNETIDEIWLLQHQSIFTLGQNADIKHLKKPSHIPVVHIDRGGQITYHGPGQLIIYTLIDLHRKQWSIRHFIKLLEQAVITLLAQENISGITKDSAPGVYVDAMKLCSIGLRVRRGATFHGLALNVAMDLTPFRAINPCGHIGLKMTQLTDLGVNIDMPTISSRITTILTAQLDYHHWQVVTESLY